jgi:hypothetical protein
MANIVFSFRPLLLATKCDYLISSVKCVKIQILKILKLRFKISEKYNKKNKEFAVFKTARFEDFKLLNSTTLETLFYCTKIPKYFAWRFQNNFFFLWSYEQEV